MHDLKLGELTPEVIEYLEKEVLPLNHSEDLLNEVKEKCQQLGPGESLPERHRDVYFSNDSYQGALLSLWATVKGIQALLDPQSGLERGYCITRPPGHHAKCKEPAGFCIFNNVALAARMARKEGKRVCIFDWDIHHGDGTQEEFYDDDQVLFISLHRCDDLSFYPYNESMQARFCGEGKGKFYNVNVAWQTGLVVDEEVRENNTRSTLGNNEYRRACDTLLFPIVEQFKPDLIIISCGFDGALHDPLGWSNLTGMMYAYMTTTLIQYCPKVLVVQEGGYNLELLGQHASGVVRALIRGTEPSSSQVEYEPTPADLEVGVKSFDDIDT